MPEFGRSDDREDGNMEDKFLHGDYDHYCNLPGYVFGGAYWVVVYQ